MPAIQQKTKHLLISLCFKFLKKLMLIEKVKVKGSYILKSIIHQLIQASIIICTALSRIVKSNRDLSRQIKTDP